MRRKKREKRNFYQLISVFVFLISVALCFLWFLKDSLIFLKKTPTQTEDGTFTEASSENSKPSEALRGVFIATVSNIDFPSSSALNEGAMKTELDAILNDAEKIGANTVIFQVRPAGDALYSSDIFPTSRYLVGEEGKDLTFDPLAYLIERAQLRKMNVIAWVNPYRITAFQSKTKLDAINQLSQKNPARKNPDWTVFYGGKLYYNPAVAEVRQLISDGVREICQKYRVKGILFDDYFYPYPVNGEYFDDSLTFSVVQSGISLEDWRRENVNSMVKICYETVKSVSQDLTFGISPFGIWKNVSSDPAGSKTNGMEAYHSLYCDATAWIEGGYVDYLAPQIYWNRGHKAADFSTLLNWWSDRVEGTGVSLYPALAAYKVSEFSDKSLEILGQISDVNDNPNSGGYFLYGYAAIQNNTENLFTLLREQAVEVSGSSNQK